MTNKIMYHYNSCPEDIKWMPVHQDGEDMKPKGLWCCLEEGVWPEFAKAEGLEGDYSHKHIIETDMSRVLVLNSWNDVKNLLAKFKGCLFVDWYLLSGSYSGIVVNEGALGHPLLRGWDIPSACLWLSDYSEVDEKGMPIWISRMVTL